MQESLSNEILQNRPLFPLFNIFLPNVSLQQLQDRIGAYKLLLDVNMFVL